MLSDWGVSVSNSPAFNRSRAALSCTIVAAQFSTVSLSCRKESFNALICCTICRSFTGVPFLAGVKMLGENVFPYFKYIIHVHHVKPKLSIFDK